MVQLDLGYPATSLISGYLYFPAAILQCTCILFTFHLFPHKILLKTTTNWMNLCLISVYVHSIGMIICYKYNSNEEIHYNIINLTELVFE